MKAISNLSNMKLWRSFLLHGKNSCWAITLTNADLWYIGNLGMNVGEIWIQIPTLSFQQVFENGVLEMSTSLFRLLCW